MAQFPSEDYEAKVLIVGDSCCGKTSLLLRLTESCFAGTYTATIGVDVKAKTRVVDGKRVKLQVWDTAGQERYQSLSQAYFKQADGVLIVFDCTNEDSFNNVTKWLMQLQLQTTPDISKVLVCTKCDLQRRSVQVQQGEALARELGLQYFETSALRNVNVYEAFQCLAKEIRLQRQIPVLVPAKAKQKRCC
jgi:Ras-related protein Rab-8A